MKKIFATLAVALSAMAFASAPAKSTPMVSIGFDGFLAVSESTFTIDELDSDLGLGLPTAVITSLDAIDTASSDFDEYSLFLALGYDITVDEPSPATPRDWHLSIDFGFEATFIDETGDDVSFETSDLEDLLSDFFMTPTTFPITGIPIADLTG